MITVLYLETGSGYGGSAQSLAGLLSAIDRSRIRPIVVAYEEGSGIAKIRALGVPVTVVGPGAARTRGYAALLWAWLTREWPRAWALERLIRAEGVDLVHLNTDIYSTVAGLWAARWTRRPVACHIRLTRPLTRLERWLGRWANAIIVPTEEAKAFYRRWWPAQRLERIWNAVEIPSQRVRPDNGRAAQGGPRVGLVARCVRGKGYEEFLRAAALVRQQWPTAQFSVIGNGPGGDAVYERRMRHLADVLLLNGALTWEGWKNNMPEMYDHLDIVAQVSTTFPEGFGRVAIEAMAMGKPVVVTALPVYQEVVGDAAVVVSVGDAQALADAILGLLRDPSRSQALVQQGQRRVLERFSLPAQAQRIMALYDEVCRP